MREQIVAWYNYNNDHPLDDNRFYDIVIASLGNKLGQETFEDALRDANEGILEEEIESIFIRYETLYDFLSYYNDHR